MKRQIADPMPDPLVDDVRRRRKELLASFGGDLSLMIEEIQRRERAKPGKIHRRKRMKAGTV